MTLQGSTSRSVETFEGSEIPVAHQVFHFHLRYIDHGAVAIAEEEGALAGSPCSIGCSRHHNL